MSGVVVGILWTFVQIRPDETVVFYPSYAYLDSAQKHWEGYVHGIVYEQEKDSLWRAGVIATVRRSLDLHPHTPEADRLAERLREFLVDRERGKEIEIRLGDQVVSAGTSGVDGYFRSGVRITDTEAQRLAGGPGGWVRYTVVLPLGDSRKFEGQVQLVGPTGLSIVSDIDDTIKHTEVLQVREMMLNTFVRPFRPVEGMAPLYQEAVKAGAVVHYVSASPWQLFVPFSEFCQQEHFPKGSFHLQHFRFDPRALGQMFSSPQQFKITQITQIIQHFPKRRFLLVGDSGQQDPEIYGQLAQAYPKQIVGIWIRKVTADPANSPRYQKAFAQVDPTIWKLFETPEELRPELNKILAK